MSTAAEEIDHRCDALVHAVENAAASSVYDRLMMTAGIELLRLAMLDLNRLADSMEVLAQVARNPAR